MVGSKLPDGRYLYMIRVLTDDGKVITGNYDEEKRIAAIDWTGCKLFTAKNAQFLVSFHNEI